MDGEGEQTLDVQPCTGLRYWRVRKWGFHPSPTLELLGQLGRRLDACRDTETRQLDCLCGGQKLALGVLRAGARPVRGGGWYLGSYCPQPARRHFVGSRRPHRRRERQHRDQGGSRSRPRRRERPGAPPFPQRARLLHRRRDSR